MKRRAYIGLGANQGDPRETLTSAVRSIGSIERTELVAVSPFYLSDPVDAEGPEFLNAVASVDTELEPYALLLHLLDIEMMLGRKRRPGEKKSKSPARKVDLDLLLHGNLILRSTPLTLPHPRLQRRAFVLKPLLDLEPSLQLPGLGAATLYLEGVADQRAERQPDAVPLPPAPQPAAPAPAAEPPAAADKAPDGGPSPAYEADADANPSTLIEPLANPLADLPLSVGMTAAVSATARETDDTRPAEPDAQAPGDTTAGDAAAGQADDRPAPTDPTPAPRAPDEVAADDPDAAGTDRPAS
jgi:2-amino-4-hydroxy-6-hydroxymethyldihydropteridine diphosphokinase